MPRFQFHTDGENKYTILNSSSDTCNYDDLQNEATIYSNDQYPLSSNLSTCSFALHTPPNVGPFSEVLQEIPSASDLLVSVSVFAEENKVRIKDLASSAIEELRQMTQEQEPLWQFNAKLGHEVLSEVEYKKRFAPLDTTLEEILKVLRSEEPFQLPNLDIGNFHVQYENGADHLPSTVPLEAESSKATGIIFTDPLSIVNMFTNVDHWSLAFANIVSRAKSFGYLFPGEDGSSLNSGSLQVISMELHAPSPHIRTREAYVARCCRQLDLQTWIVVDVSLESIFPNQELHYQRRPSGCLIQELQSGLSTVTWVEHVSVHNGFVPHPLKHFVESGIAFRATRWIAALERHYHKVTISESKHNDLNPVPQLHDQLEVGKENLLMLAERMMRRFHANLSSSSDNPWRPLPIAGAENIMVKTSSKMPCGVAVSIATSVWLPISQHHLFDFLRASENRNRWDLLSYGSITHEVMRTFSPRDPSSWISIISVKPRQDKPEIFYMQESFCDVTAFYVVYAPIDHGITDSLVNAKKIDNVTILPSGFVVLPDKPDISGENRGTGSLLTISFQLMDEELLNPRVLPPRSVFTAYKIITETVSLIKASMIP